MYFLISGSVVNELLSQLPVEQRTIEHLEGTIRSPQLQQALTSLSEALLNPENFNNVVRNFNLDPTRAALVRAIEFISLFRSLMLYKMRLGRKQRYRGIFEPDFGGISSRIPARF